MWIRNYRGGDARQLVGVDTAVSPNALKQRLTHSSFCWVVEVDGTAVGYAALNPVPGLVGLYQLDGGIVPSVQRRGVGAALLTHLLTSMQGTAVTHISCSVDELDGSTAHLLQQHGFVLEHEEWQMKCVMGEGDFEAGEQTAVTLRQLSHQQTIVQLPSLYDRAFAGTDWYQPFSTEEVQATLTSPDEFWVLEVDGETLGFAWLHFPQLTLCEIEPIGVVQGHQGRGYGRLLLTTILQKLKQRGVTAVSLGVWRRNKKAIRLYESLHFKKMGATYFFVRQLSNRT